MKIRYKNSLIVIGFLLFTALLSVHMYIKADKLEQTIFEAQNPGKIISESDMTARLEVGEPEYVDFDEIMTANPYIENTYSSKYSQIKVKNIGDGEIYDLSINLEKFDPDSYSGTVYISSLLNPGETAILSHEHTYMDTEKKLKILGYSYLDSKNTKYDIKFNKPDSYQSNKKKEKIIRADVYENYMFEELTPDIEKIKISNIRYTDTKNGKFLMAEVKNTTDLNLKSIRLDFNEIHEGNIVGYTDTRIDELKPYQTKTIVVAFKDEVELKSTGYFYELIDIESKDGNTDYYTVYSEPGTYRKYSFPDFELQDKRRKMLYIVSSLTSIAFLEINKKLKDIKVKCAETGAANSIMTKLLALLKLILVLAYVIWLYKFI